MSLRLDGRAGAPAKDGVSYHRASGRRGTHGRRGGDATRARPGEPAASLVCQIRHADETSPSDGRRSDRLMIRGQISQPGGVTVDVNETVGIGAAGYLFVNAQGGRGGNGGRGGDGQPGSVGTNGSNATRYSRGTNGGPGGHGGNAGNPSDGGDGGPGGDVTLVVPEDQTGVLMLVKGNLAPGDIGFAGEPGQGGRGGKGGRGGSSYHWTETDTYTDSNGKTQTRTRFCSNPGGSNGRSGRNGAPSSYVAADGRPGSPGRLRVRVEHADGNNTIYDSPYDLRVVTFDVAREYSLLEPDSLISVDQLVIRNTGGMPTPHNYTVRIFLMADDWLDPIGAELTLAESIGPGETYQFTGAGLKVRLGDYQVQAPRKRPFRLTHPVSPMATLESGIGRPFRQFETPEIVEVQFPVELTAITALPTLAPGESTLVRWSVVNRGTETFDQQYLRRAVQSKLRIIGGDLQPHQIVFFDIDDRDHDLGASEFRHPIRGLDPGQRCQIETRIGFPDESDLVAYQAIEFGVDLHLQRPASSDRSSEYRCVDYRKATIRVAERYRRDQTSNFLLIANQDTTDTQINQWTQLADYFGSTLDIWDVSYNGFFDLIRDVENDESLLEQWRGMTMIVPNNYFFTPVGKTTTLAHLSKTQFLRAAADHDINFYIVGDARTGGAQMLARSMIPVDGSRPSKCQTAGELLREVKRWNRYVGQTRHVVGAVAGDAREFADTSVGHYHRLPISKRTLLFQPDAKWLLRQAQNLQAKLRKQDPLHRWVVVHRYDTGQTDTKWGFFRQRQVGSIEVRRSLDSSKGSAVLYEVDEIKMLDSDFINSDENKHGVFLALKFEDKVDRFVRIVSERIFPRFSETYVDRPLTDEEVEAIGTQLLDSILLDLFNEQLVARQSKVWGAGSVDALTPKLNYLAERSLNYGVTYDQLNRNAVNLQLLYKLVAHLKYIASESKTIWDSAVLPTAYFKRGRAVSNHLTERADRIVTNVFGRQASLWERMFGGDDDESPFGGSTTKPARWATREKVDAIIDDLEQELRRSRSPLTRYLTPQLHKGLHYDPEMLTPEQRVMSAAQYDRLVAEERREDEVRKTTEQAVLDQRSELLVPLRQRIQTPTAIPTATVQAGV